jgi:16S rRNA C967 or C1407 C5-methylase (RsmB/RsmF family)
MPRRAAPNRVPPPKPAKPQRGDDPPVVLKEENTHRATKAELERRLSVRAAVSPAFLAALKRDFAEHGAEAIAQTRRTAPSTYVRLAAAVLPLDAPEARPAPTGAPEETDPLQRRIAELRAILAGVRERGADEGEGS